MAIVFALKDNKIPSNKFERFRIKFKDPWIIPTPGSPSTSGIRGDIGYARVQKHLGPSVTSFGHKCERLFCC